MNMNKLPLIFLAVAGLFPAFSCSKDGETTPPKTYLDCMSAEILEKK